MRSAFNLGAATELGAIGCWSRANYCARTLNVFLALSGFVVAAPLFLLAIRMCGIDATKRSATNQLISMVQFGTAGVDRSRTG